MKAAQHTSYNKNNITLNLTDIAKPQIKPNQVLVKVTAAGVNPLDNMISRGDVKLIVPYKLPQTAGNELVGLIEEVGATVTNFAAGDRVFGRLPLDSIGAFAEYVAVDAQALAKVPAYLTDEEAAAVPLTALTIMQALDLMGAEAGKTVFISGGTGGVGGMAIPIAKAKGLTVITNGEFAKRMNLPKWKQVLFGLVGRKFDKMVDNYGVHYHFIFVESNGRQLQEVADIFSKLEIKPSIDTVYPFEEVDAALDKVANGRSRGKTVLRFN
ncbi:NADP-dependent oxidoreductase [Streptococcus suis]|nr:NADP-dependent oxidoreductase [Streptococcus suis]HEM4158365.1 NADP-dependent oxidoreductase [Streptococcus suis]